MKRRTFLTGVGSALGLGAAVAAPAQDKTAVDAARKGLPRRTLGRTGAKVSVVGFPGLALRRCDQAEATAGIHKAFDNGVNYFDIAPAYGNGDCEIKMGIGLEGIDRSKIFLSCKTKRRDKQGAREELERSLERLKTDYFDLYQLHCLVRPEEVEEALSPGGAMETIIAAKEEGKLKHIGFSAHTTKAALAALDRFDFDTIMFPVNFVEHFTIQFDQQVLRRAAEKGAGVISIKPVSRGRWPKSMKRTRQNWYRTVEDPKDVGMAMRFALDQPGVATGIPVSFLDITDTAIRASRVDRPNTEAETAELEKMAATCESLFRRVEQDVAAGIMPPRPHYPDSPHECPCRLYG